MSASPARVVLTCDMRRVLEDLNSVDWVALRRMLSRFRRVHPAPLPIDGSAYRRKVRSRRGRR